MRRRTEIRTGKFDRASAHGMTFDEAWATGKVGVLRNWFRDNTGPTIPLTKHFVGDFEVADQTDADDLVGTRVVGRLRLTGSGTSETPLELHDFEVAWDGSGTGANLVETVNGEDHIHLTDFRLNGNYGNISYGLTGTTFSEGITAERGEIVRMGGDGLRTHKNSTYRHMYIHDFREWNVTRDGVYDANGSQSLYPHTDGVQVIRSGNTVEQSWIENTDATNATSGLIVKPDADEAITAFTFDKNLIDGGGVPFYVDNSASNIDSPGTNGQPTGLVFTNLRVGRNFREGRVWRHDEVPSSSFTKTDIVWADDGTPVPAVFVDGFNRANENLEANAFWNRISGAAGALTVDTNQVRSTATAQSTFLLDEGIVSPTNHFVETDWKSGTTTGWMLARYVDENNYVGMQILASVPTLYTRVGGTFTVRVSSGSSLSAGDKVRIEAFGQEIRLWHKGILRGTYTMGTGVLTSGRVGLQARTTVANPMTDNFIAGDLME